MAYRQFSGTATFIDAGVDCGQVTVALEHFPGIPTKAGRGSFSGDGRTLQVPVHSNGPHRLRLEDGLEIPIAITRARLDGAEFSAKSVPAGL